MLSFHNNSKPNFLTMQIISVTKIQAEVQYNVHRVVVLYAAHLYPASAFTFDCLNSSVSFSIAAALSNVSCCINDAISFAALRSMLRVS